MSEKVGVVRDARGLKAALSELSKIALEAKGDTILENMTLTARLITAAALQRKESRGGHFRSDFPDTDQKQARRSFMTLKDLAKIDAPKRTMAAIAAAASCAP